MRVTGNWTKELAIMESGVDGYLENTTQSL